MSAVVPDNSLILAMLLRISSIAAASFVTALLWLLTLSFIVSMLRAICSMAVDIPSMPCSSSLECLSILLIRSVPCSAFDIWLLMKLYVLSSCRLDSYTMYPICISRNASG